MEIEDQVRTRVQAPRHIVRLRTQNRGGLREQEVRIGIEVAGGRWLYATFLQPCNELPSSISARFRWSLSVDLQGRRVGVILSGGNVELDWFAGLADSAVAAAHPR